VLLFVVGPAGPAGPTTKTALLPPRSYGKPVGAAAVDRLLMMGMKMPETCWAVSKRQAVNMLLIAASIWLIHLNLYICIYLIYKYSRGLHNTVWRAALWTAMHYIIATRCEILMILGHKLLRLITLLTFPLDFSTVWDNSMWHTGL